MANNNEKKSRHDKYRNISVYLPKELREQLLFYCKYKNIKPSTLCSTLIKRLLTKYNVAQLMIDYALEQVDFNCPK